MSLHQRLAKMEARIAALEARFASLDAALEEVLPEDSVGPALVDLSGLDGPAAAHAERDQTQSLG